MSWTTPSWMTLLARVRADLLAATGENPATAGTWAYALAYVASGLWWHVHGRLAAMARELLPSTSSSETLRRIATQRGCTPITAATATGGVAWLWASVGTTIPEGTLLRRAYNGWLLRVTADTTYDTAYLIAHPGADPTAFYAPVEAVEPGSAGNAATGNVEVVTPVVGLRSIGTVMTPTTGGQDDETDAALLARLIQYLSAPRCGYAYADLVNTAQGTALSSGDTVGPVWIEDDTDPGLNLIFYLTTGTPSAGDETDVQAAIDAIAPAATPGNHVTVIRATQQLVTFRILLVTDTPANRTAVQDALDAMLLANSVPGGTIRNSVIREAISAGGPHTLAAINGGAGTANVVVAANKCAVRGTITWT